MNIGVDIGGTKIIAAVRDADSQLIITPKAATPAAALDGLAVIIDQVTQLLGDQPLASLGLSWPGQFDRSTRRIMGAPHLTWHDTHIVMELENRLGAPVSIGNDASLAALAEAREGAGKTAHTMLYVTISTGVNTGLIQNGRMFSGTYYPEGGHTIIPGWDGLPATIDATISGTGIRQRYGKIAADIHDENIWEEIAAKMAESLIGLINFTTPDLVVLGGGVSTHFDRFGGLLASALDKLYHPYPLPAIVPAANIETSAVLGAVILAEDQNHSA